MNRILASAAIDSDRTLNRSPVRANRVGKSGSSLVEVMVACVILLIIAVAGAEYLSHGQATLAFQKNRRLALEVANSEMEKIEGMSYGAITNLLPNNPRSFGVVNIGTNVNIGGATLPMTRTFRYFDADAGSSTYDAVWVSVSVRYRSDLGDQITLHTLRSL